MKKYQFLSENFHFLEVKFSIYLYGRVFVMSLSHAPMSVLNLFIPELKPSKFP